MCDSLGALLPIVIDNGSSTCRMGFAGGDTPTGVFPNMIGRPLNISAKGDYYVGDRAQSRREVLSLHYPVQRGIVTNWDDMEKIWHYGFSQQLRISPNDHAVITSEPPLNPRANAEMIARVLFEKFQVSGIHFGDEASHVLFAYGRGIGLVVNVGHGVTYVKSRYYDGGPVTEVRADFGGLDLTIHLQKLLYTRGFPFTTSSELNELSRVKENTCLVAESKETFRQIQEGEWPASSEPYAFQDGAMIDVLGPDRYSSPELLFQEGGVNEGNGHGIDLPGMILSSLQDRCIDTRGDLLCNILLTGGTSLCRGFKERLQSELKNRTPESKRVKVVHAPESLISPWIGMSIQSSLAIFPDEVITRQEYEEFGPAAVGNSPNIAYVRRKKNTS